MSNQFFFFCFKFFLIATIFYSIAKFFFNFRSKNENEIVYENFVPQNFVPQSFPPQKCSGPKRNLMFLKTHKTGGSTLQNIFMRFGYRHGLVFVLPPAPGIHLGYPEKFSADAALPKPEEWVEDQFTEFPLIFSSKILQKTFYSLKELFRKGVKFLMDSQGNFISFGIISFSE